MNWNKIALRGTVLIIMLVATLGYAFASGILIQRPTRIDMLTDEQINDAYKYKADIIKAEEISLKEARKLYQKEYERVYNSNLSNVQQATKLLKLVKTTVTYRTTSTTSSTTTTTLKKTPFP